MGKKYQYPTKRDKIKGYVSPTRGLGEKTEGKQKTRNNVRICYKSSGMKEAFSIRNKTNISLRRKC